MHKWSLLLSTSLLVTVGLGGACADIPAERYLSNSNTIEQVPLEGTWVVVEVVLGGYQLPVPENDTINMQWSFSERKVKFRKGKELEEGTYRINRSTSPQRLDLQCTTDDGLEIRQCIFEVEGDNAKIAYSVQLIPGTPEQEIERAKEMHAKRPKSFDVDQDLSPSTLILVLRRAKQ